MESVQRVLREKVPSDEIQFTKAYIRWGDRILTNFSFARPLVANDCVDLERTKINYWDLQDDLFSNFDNLVLDEERIPTQPFSRTRYLLQVLISDELKEALDEVNDSTMFFVRPEDMRPWYRW